MGEFYQESLQREHGEFPDALELPRSPSRDSLDLRKDTGSISQSYFFSTEEDDMSGGMIEGSIESPSNPSWYTVLFMIFCPCLLGDPFSAEKKAEYKRAFKTMSLIITILEIVMFIISISLHGITSPSTNWLIGPSAATLSDMGAKNTYLMYHSWHVHRWFSPIFLHAGIIHIVVNLFAQLRMGLYLERRWGWIKFTSVYFCSGMYGVMLSCIIQPSTIAVAASASVLGLTGAYLTQILITWHKMGNFQRGIAVTQCVLVTAVLSLMAIGPDFIDWSCHMGAMCCGFGMGFIMFGREYARSKHIMVKRVMPVVCGLLIGCTYLGGIVLFYSSIVPIPSSNPG